MNGDFPKLEIGSGDRPTEGYIHMDIKKNKGVDVVGDARKLPFPDNSLSEIYGMWVLEHFFYQEIPDILREWNRALIPGGELRMITNHGDAHFQAYMERKITVHDLNRLLYGSDLFNRGINKEIEDLHKIFWTEELVWYFFRPIFRRTRVNSSWVHREPNGDLKCPAMIIVAKKNEDEI